MSSHLAIIVLVCLFGLFYVLALYQAGKEISELPEKIDRILCEIYNIK